MSARPPAPRPTARVRDAGADGRARLGIAGFVVCALLAPSRPAAAAPLPAPRPPAASLRPARAADDTVRLTLLDDSVIEGNNGRRALQFSVTTSRAITTPVSVSYQTGDGTATAASGDYDAAAGTLVIQPVAPAFAQAWGTAGFATGKFYCPYALAVDPSGNVFVADRDNFRIQKFSSSGVFLAKWGSRGSAPGQFRFPQGIAVDGNGEVYVADTGNHRIQKFTNDGVYLASWGVPGPGGGEFRQPCGVATDRNGSVYVADTGNDRVQKFTEAGVYLAEWGTEGVDHACFSFPQGVAADGDGNVYVLDSGNHRVQRFSSDGAYLGQWGSSGAAPGQLRFPYGIAVDGNGSVYVADSYNHRVQAFTRDGALIATWGGFGGGNGAMKYPNGIAVDGQGQAFVADSHNHRVQRFQAASSGAAVVVDVEGDGRLEPDEWLTVTLSNPAGAVLARAEAAGTIVDDDANGAVEVSVGDAAVVEGAAGSAPIAFAVTVSRALDAPVSFQFRTADGTATAADNDYTPTSGTVTLQPLAPVFGGKWGTQGSAAGKFIAPTGAALDAIGTIYVLDMGNHRVQRFTTGGAFLAQWGSYGSGPGQFAFARGIAWHGGNLYVADTQNHRIQKFSATGTLLAAWGVAGSGNGQFNGPQGITVAADGTVYVTDTGNERVQRFTSQGAYLGQWGSAGNGDGQFSGPIGVATDAAGAVYVVDSSNQRIQKFTAAGAFVGKWGTLGSGDGQFLYPYGIAATATGKLVVADTYNHRLQEFTGGGTFIRHWGEPGSGDAQFNLPEGLVVDASGTAYVADKFNHRMQRFQPQAPSATIAVPVRGDVKPESDEVFSVELSSPSGAVVPDDVAVGRILNDDGSSTGLEDVPAVASLQVLGANPARGPLRLRLGIPSRTAVDLSVFDVAGRRVTTLWNGMMAPGRHDVTWSESSSRRPRRAGIYLVRLTVGDRVFTRRVAVLD